jgi:plasmid stabilization system protein ParE
MRSIVVVPYLIFYRVREDSVQIVRVLHGHRDIEAMFTD